MSRNETSYTVTYKDEQGWIRMFKTEVRTIKESLTSALRDIKKNVDDWNLQDYVTIRRLVNDALRTAEESSVVDLIDSTHAKQSPNAVNADGDGDSVIDEEVEVC